MKRPDGYRGTKPLSWILPAAVLLGALGAAAADRGRIHLLGVVPPSCVLSVADRGVVFDLAAGERTAVVATIEEQCNAPAGYIVKMESRNGGRMASPEGGSLPYTMLYDDARAVGGRGDLVAQRSRPGWQTRELSVTAGRQGDVEAGTYGDLVTVTIEAK